LRIVCTSNGEDNGSQQSVFNVAFSLCPQGIILDPFFLGDASSQDLQTLSYLTKDCVLEPQILGEAMAICELEPVLSSLERPEKDDKSSHDEDQPY
jgi:hypothetical protein